MDDADADGGFHVAEVWKRRLLTIEATDRVLDAPRITYFASPAERHVARVMITLLVDLALISINQGRQATKDEMSRVLKAIDELQQAVAAIVDTRDRLPDLAPIETLLNWYRSRPQREHAKLNQVEKFSFPLLLSFYQGIFGKAAGQSPQGPAARFVITFNAEVANMLRASTRWNERSKVQGEWTWPEPSADNVAQKIRTHIMAADANLGWHLRAKFLRQIEESGGIPSLH